MTYRRGEDGKPEYLNKHFQKKGSGQVIVSTCPQCGSPIYAPNEWWGLVAPPVSRTCHCDEEGEMFETVRQFPPDPPCLTLLKLCPLTDEYKGESAFHDVVVGMKCRCELACEGNWDLALCGKHPLIEEEEPPVTVKEEIARNNPLPGYVEALEELRDRQKAAGETVLVPNFAEALRASGQKLNPLTSPQQWESWIKEHGAAVVPNEDAVPDLDETDASEAPASHVCLCGAKDPAMISPRLIYDYGFKEKQCFLKCLACGVWIRVGRLRWLRQKAKWDMALVGHHSAEDAERWFDDPGLNFAPTEDA